MKHRNHRLLRATRVPAIGLSLCLSVGCGGPEAVEEGQRDVAAAASDVLHTFEAITIYNMNFGHGYCPPNARHNDERCVFPAQAKRVGRMVRILCPDGMVAAGGIWGGATCQVKTREFVVETVNGRTTYGWRTLDPVIEITSDKISYRDACLDASGRSWFLRMSEEAQRTYASWGRSTEARFSACNQTVTAAPEDFDNSGPFRFSWGRGGLVSPQPIERGSDEFNNIFTCESTYRKLPHICGADANRNSQQESGTLGGPA